VNDGYVNHNEPTREDGEDVIAIFAVGGGSSPETIHCGLTSSAHTSAMSNSAPGLKKHIMAQRNCFGVGRATHGVVRRWRGRAGSVVTRNRRGAKGHLGEAGAMTEGAGEGSIGEGEGVGIEPDGGGTAGAAVKPGLGSVVWGKGDQQRVKSTKSDGARNDPLSSGEDTADDIIRERTARSREGVRGRIVDGVPKGRICGTSRRGKGAEGFRVMEHGSMGEGKGREEGSVGIDGSEMAEAEATKLEGQGDLGCDGASSLTRLLDQGEHSITQLGLHTSEGCRKDVPRDGTSEMRHVGLEGGAQDEGLVLKGEG
jgi:hypothetical protein